MDVKDLQQTFPHQEYTSSKSRCTGKEKKHALTNLFLFEMLIHKIIKKVQITQNLTMKTSHRS